MTGPPSWNPLRLFVGGFQPDEIRDAAAAIRVMLERQLTPSGSQLLRRARVRRAK
jgi:hypothetical protein